MKEERLMIGTRQEIRDYLKSFLKPRSYPQKVGECYIIKDLDAELSKIRYGEQGSIPYMEVISCDDKGEEIHLQIKAVYFLCEPEFYGTTQT